jgi:prepilin-type N-terminal cleavage/methylation domain-containing protein
MSTGLHPRRDEGFTLIEILVVLLILGVLAAIALPTLTGQKEQAYDTDAKSLARNLQTHVESCYVEQRDWNDCNSAAEVPGTGMTWGTDPGEVQVLVRPFGRDFVAFAATSETRTLFAIVHGTSDRDISRVCFVPANAYPTGSCRRGGAFSALGFGTW